MAVLYVPHFVYFADDDGNPLSGGKLYTYAAGTNTPKATYTTAAGDIENANPVELDSAGRATVFLSGSYKFSLTTAGGVVIRTTDNVTSFNATTETTEGFFQAFSGDGATTAFTLSENLGTDERALTVQAVIECVTNGAFTTDTGWSKGAGWTIAAGVATATGAISTAIEQSSAKTLVNGRAYSVKYTITRSAGTITLSLGGTAGTARSADGTYSETIIAGSTQTISFGTSGFTGTLDNVTITETSGPELLNPASFTLNGTALTITPPPAIGTGNIMVWAPYTLIGAAGAAQVAADEAIAAAANAEAFVDAGAFKYAFDSSTSMADPGTGDFRLNNATIASATAIAVDALTTSSGNPDVSDAIAAWDVSTSITKGQLRITKQGTPATFAVFDITAITDNTGWLELAVTYVDGNGTLSAADVCFLQFIQTGDKGDPGGPITDGDYGDIVASGGGSVLTIDTAVVTNAKMANMAEATIKGRAASAGTGAPVDLTATQVRTLADVYSTTETNTQITNAIAAINFGAGAAALAAGDVGTYMCAVKNSSSGVSDFGSTVAGSTLDPCSLNADISATVPSGTWRSMGYAGNGTTTTPRATLWLRTV